MKAHESVELQYLMIRFFDGTITESEFELLNRTLKENESARRLYFKFLKVSLAMRNVRYLNKSGQDDLDMESFLSELGQYEQLAPAVVVEDMDLEESVPFRKLKVEKKPFKLNKYSFYTALTALAATILIVATINFLPPRFSPEPLARILDSQRAEWIQHENYKNRSILLKGTLEVTQGTLNFAMYDGTEVNLEAPAVVDLVNIDQIYLEKGSVRATVPPVATGFTVCTPSGSVVDFGTEFSVAVDQRGSTFVEVFKGVVELRDSSNPLVFKNSQKLTVGQSGTINTAGEITWKDPVNSDVNVETRVRWDCPESTGLWTNSSYWTRGLVRGTELVSEFRAREAPTTVLVDDSVTGSDKIRARRADVCLLSRYPVTVQMDGGQIQLEQLWIGRMGTAETAEGRWLMSDGELVLKGRDRAMLFIGDTCKGLMEMDGGSVEVFGAARVGCNEGVLTKYMDSDGTLVVNDGTMTIYGLLEVAYADSVGAVYLNGGQIHAFDIRIGNKGVMYIGDGTLILEGNRSSDIGTLIKAGSIKSQQSEIAVDYDEQGTLGFGRDKTIVRLKE